MLSDSGCFRFAAPLGATKAEPNRSAKVQPIDGDPLTVPSIEAGGEQVLLLGDELVCSENRAVQRKHKNGLRFTSVRREVLDKGFHGRRYFHIFDSSISSHLRSITQ